MKRHAKIVAWYDMEGHAKKVRGHPFNDHSKEEVVSVGELSKVCSQVVLKCLYLARIGGLDNL